VLRQHRRPGWRATRLRNSVHVRRDAAATVPDRVSRWPPAGVVDCLGHTPTGGRGAALVPPLPWRDTPGAGPAALDRAGADLELSVRRVPLDRPAEVL